MVPILSVPQMLEECRGISLAMANVNRGHPSLLKHGMELLCIVSQVPYQGEWKPI
jgi:hypothetical protein